jgi:hypothetical protein
MTETTDVFASYGRAAYYAQLVEYDLVSIWILDSVTQGLSLTHADLAHFQGDWSKKTLGALLRPLERSTPLPEDLKEFLEQLRNTRNTLAHNCYLSPECDLRTPETREKAISRLNDIGSVLIKGHELFSGVLKTYARDFGIDCDQIVRQLVAEVPKPTQTAAEPGVAPDAGRAIMNRRG